MMAAAEKAGPTEAVEAQSTTCDGAPAASKEILARDFGAASASYDQAARLQRHMGHKLMQALADVGPVRRVVDLGCGTGQFADCLRTAFPQAAILGADLSEPMLRHAREERQAVTEWLVADAEQLPLATGSVDVIFSNLMIQWCPDPRPVLRECLRVLRPGGVLVCSTLLAGTLRELATAWALADPGVNHVNRFEEAPRLESLVRQVFPAAGIKRETVVLPYDSPLALLGELKSLGARYKGEGRRRTVTAPGRLRQLLQGYPRQQDQVLASYEAAYLVCRRPA